MTTGIEEAGARPRASAPPPAPAGLPAASHGGSRPQTAITTAILVATAPADDAEGAAAAQPWEESTLARRLADQLASLGVHTAHVITRPAWAPALEQALGGAARVHACASTAEDLAAVAAAAREAPAGVVIAHADIVTHREALAGLLADPRVSTGILVKGGRRPLAFRVRTARGRVVSASSPFHNVWRATTTFLGVLKVSAADRPALVDATERLAALAEPPLPPEWPEELERKAEAWRIALSTEPEDPEAPPLLPEHLREPEVRRRIAVIREDVAALVLVGLVRSGVQLGAGHLRQLFWARPLSREQLEQAAVDIQEFDEEKVLLDASVKATDGFFTSFFVSPYSRYIARWAAGRGISPNTITTISLLIGVLAATAFATGERAGLVAGAVLAYVAFVTDCVDGQLARYTRTFSKLGAWLDSVFDRTKEYVIFAGLAIGSERMGADVWALAGAALALQTVRHTFDFSFAAAQHQVIGRIPLAPLEQAADPARPAREAVSAADAIVSDQAEPEQEAAEREPEPADPPLTLRDVPRRVLRLWRMLDRAPGVVWLKRMVAFPIGERFAVISLVTALSTPRTTFIVLLAWGGFAAAYTFTGRLLRSIAA